MLHRARKLPAQASAAALALCSSLLLLSAIGCGTTGASHTTAVGREPPTHSANNGKQRSRVVHEPEVHPPLWKKFNPVWWFGNWDDPEPPGWFRPDRRYRNRLWYVRNLLHNFMFYVVGIADQRFVRTGRYPGEVFSPQGGWNWAVCRYKCLLLPFVSFQKGDFKFYLGWRERGNFGVKLNF